MDIKRLEGTENGGTAGALSWCSGCVALILDPNPDSESSQKSELRVRVTNLLTLSPEIFIFCRAGPILKSAP